MSTVNFNNLIKEFSDFENSTKNMKGVENKDKYLKEEKKFFDFFNEYCDYIEDPKYDIIPASITKIKKLFNNIRNLILTKRSEIYESKEVSENLKSDAAKIRSTDKPRLAGRRPEPLTSDSRIGEIEAEYIKKFIDKIKILKINYKEKNDSFNTIFKRISDILKIKSDKELYEKIKELDENIFNDVEHEDDGNDFNESWSAICAAIHKSVEQEPKDEKEYEKFREKILVLLKEADSQARKFIGDYRRYEQI